MRIGLLLALSWVYVSLGSVPVVAALFYGLKPAVVAVVLEAVVRIGKRALRTGFLAAIAGAAFLGNAVLGAPFPVLVLGAGLVGVAAGRLRPALVGLSAPVPGAEGAAPGLSAAGDATSDGGRCSMPYAVASRSFSSLTRGVPSRDASARSSSSQGRFVVCTRPSATGPATSKHAASTPRRR